MDRTVPKTGSEEIELYMRTYYSLLRSTHTFKVESLVESHMATESTLHVQARSPEPDVSALIYTSLRLPACMTEVDFVLLGQLEKSFVDANYPVTEWEQVYSPGRRRRMHFDGAHRLAVFVSSRSDIDDLIPILTAYQIEWNKLNALLQTEVARLFLAQYHDRTTPLSESELVMLAATLQLDSADLRRIEVVWGTRFIRTLYAMSRERKSIGIRQIAGSLADYRRATSRWWDDLAAQVRDRLDLEDRPVYFVSSNTHSLPNLLTGFALREEKKLLQFIEARGHESLMAEFRAIQADGGATTKPNFLYYISKKYLADSDDQPSRRLRDDEAEIGIHRVPSRHGADFEAQVIELSKLRPDWLDPRICGGIDYEWLSRSDAVIVNVDYPLGLAAYEILMRVSEKVSPLLGVYIMGKAATLNGRIGDVMISNVVHDEHSQNTYLFNNCFTAQDVAPFLTFGSVLDNQKVISALGTFLQNPRYMSVFYQEGYTVIEMEAGPYLSSVYEAFRPKRHPQNEIANLYGVPFDVGILHYASDTPFTKGKNLGTNLSYAGVDPTYATSIAIMHRILNNEAARAGAGSAVTAGDVVAT
ncbi:MAG: hypothetical protein IT319_10165 [Anaerolineae bacterium]|nr:hypothetical protein [Anaerolineae bacterium]